MNGKAGEGALYGIHAVLGVLKQRPGVIHALWLSQEARNPRLDEIRTLALQHRIPLKTVTPDELNRRAAGERHQDVLALFDPAGIVFSEHDLDALLAQAGPNPLLLVLDGVQDPHNLGACLRTADAAGAHAVIIPRDRAVGITPVVCKVASGAVGHIPLVQVTNLARTLRGLRDAGIWLVGTDMAGETPLHRSDLNRPLALILGAEEKGLRRLTREACDWLVSIPMAGAVESLNVSVAAGICLFEARRQRLSAEVSK
ncbi:MAG: 23S rRNA (guanosine(2251)-2'-O)-methyltransferase RlmB [Gammaproteobacteria bacterium]|nr:23S rRNA (guanosine(2251)-2'-O)-methyltransferase RlmB [Gammaproteobacteria bacterium]